MAYAQWPLGRIAFGLALLFHILLAMLPWDRILPTPTFPSRVEIQTIDPATLRAIRERMNQKNKKFLYSADKSKPDPSAARPENARFESDRNRVVKEETRARVTRVMPKPGAAGEPTKQAGAPPLKNLGIRYAADGSRGLLPRGVLREDLRKQQIGESGGQQGGDVWVDDSEVKEGSHTVLNSEQSVYYSFYARLYEQIAPLWESRIRSIGMERIRSIPPSDYVSKVDVVLDADGFLRDIEFIVRSGIDEFDEAVRYSWTKAQQFPNPPRALLNERGEVHTGWTFTVNMSHQGGFQYSAPRRVY